jgi:molecular chaperone DnaJ
MENLYKILGVNENATADDIRAAFKVLAKQCHPDTIKCEADKAQAESRFKEITHAYDILSDQNKRTAYDRELHGRNFYVKFNAGNAGNFYNMGTTTGAPFNVFYNSPINASEPPFSLHAPPTDVKFFISVTQFYAQKKFNCMISTLKKCAICDGLGGSMGAIVPCPMCSTMNVIRSNCVHCHGYGKIRNKTTCGECSGTGTVQNRRTMLFEKNGHIGNSLLFEAKGEGNYDQRSRKYGDLYCKIVAVDDGLFSVDGVNIKCDLWIDFPTAACGGRIKIPTLDGAAEINISPGTLDGTCLRMNGMGLETGSSVPGCCRGDQIVTVKIDIPKMQPGEYVDVIKAAKHSKLEKFNERVAEMLRRKQKGHDGNI